jgi:hypothetical protein
MTAITLTLNLDPITVDWLLRESAAVGREPAEFVAELLRELADPDHIEGDLIDQLLAASANSFPPVSTLEEQDEHREEVLNDLCRRIAEGFQKHTGIPLSDADASALRERLAEHAQEVWTSR